jgi:hypothetical protein
MSSSYAEKKLKPVLNLQAIEASLRGVQSEFAAINQSMRFSLEQMDEEVVDNLISGYSLINYLLEANIELFDLGNSAYLLELNTRVLCGTNEQKRIEYHKYIAANERYFYERTDAGIQDLSEWYKLHRHESVWYLVASIYIRMLSEPQVFIEGNDRTGALVINYILAKEGQVPFVLTTANAKTYFKISALIKQLPRNGLVKMFRLPFLKARIADFLKGQAHTRGLK